MRHRWICSLVAGALVAGALVAGALVAGALVTACSSAASVSVRSIDTLAPPPDTVLPTVPVENPSQGDGVGDRLFPALGNPGIDVTNYDLRLVYDPALDAVDGTVALDVTLTENRQQITLDSSGPQVEAVSVDGDAAVFQQSDPELRITLPTPAAAGHRIRVEVAYHLDPRPQPSVVGLTNGWFNTPGGAYVLNEPDAAHTWFPCNDHPSDKATYTTTVKVPAGLTAVSNGELTDHRSEGASERWTWREQRPMATYLLQLFVGDYELISGEGPHGLPLSSVVLRSDLAVMQPVLDTMPAQLQFFEQYFGLYPLDRYGIAMTDSYAGLAMETQERSYFSRDDFLGGVDHSLLAHELAHQWFGDAVSPQRWTDIWLNESFATYGEWMWLDHIGESSLSRRAQAALDQRLPGSTATPSAREMFGYNSYDGGAVVVHALRLELGDELFFTLLRRWVHDNNGTSRTTEDFTALAEDVAGRSLTEFFATWLYAAQPPTRFPR